MMRRKFCLALSLLLLFACLAPGAAFAATPPQLTIVYGGGAPPLIASGHTVTVPFTIETDQKLEEVFVWTNTPGYTLTSSTLDTTIAAGSINQYTATFYMGTYGTGQYNLDLRVQYKISGTQGEATASTQVKKALSPDIQVPVQPDDDVNSNDLSAIILNPTVANPVVKGKPGERVRLALNLYNRSALMLTNVQVWPKVSTNVEEYPFEILTNNMTRQIGSMSSGRSDTVNFDFVVSEKATNGTKIVTFIAGYTENGKYHEFPVTIYLTVYGASEKPGEKPEDPTTPLILSGKDKAGDSVKTPVGDAGGTITVLLPIKNRSDKTITGIEIYPQISTDLNTFPFAIESASYDRSISSLKPGATADVKYSFKIADKATSGVKAVAYSVIYRDADGASHQVNMTSYVNIRKGYVDSTITPPDKDALVVQPKLLITAYDMPNPLYAGEEFTLTFTILNASDTDTVKNLKLTFDSDGAILPVRGGSSSLFVGTLKPGESTTESINFQAAADAASKAHLLNVTMDYNNAGVNSFTSKEVLTIPIKQQMRVTVDEPVIYVEGASVNMPFYANITFYNKGKSQLYNVALKLKSENDTMRLEEGYYGGNMGSGSSASAEVSIIPLQAGDLFGTFVISYEDEEGTPYEMEKEFTVYIQDNSGGGMLPGDGGMLPGDGGMLPGDGGMYPVDGGAGEGLPSWAWYAIGGGGAVLLVGLFLLLKKRAKAKRAKELEAA